MRSNEAFDPPPLWAIHLIYRRSSNPCCLLRLLAPPRGRIEITLQSFNNNSPNIVAHEAINIRPAI